MFGEPTRPIKLDKFARRLACRRVPHNDATTNAEIAVPPSGVQRTSVRGDTKLDIAALCALLADGLELGGEGINMASDNGHAVTRLVGLAYGETDKCAAVATDKVFTASLELASPVVSCRQLHTSRHESA